MPYFALAGPGSVEAIAGRFGVDHLFLDVSSACLERFDVPNDGWFTVDDGSSQEDQALARFVSFFFCEVPSGGPDLVLRYFPTPLAESSRSRAHSVRRVSCGV